MDELGTSLDYEWLKLTILHSFLIHSIVVGHANYMDKLLT